MLLRYAILYHSGVETPHYDLMFETSPGSELATWRSPVWPLLQPAVLTRLADHRRDYLTYEGPVSNNRGEVKQVSAGVCTIRRFDEDQFWSIRFPDLQLPPLHLKFGDADQWLAMLECY